MPDRSAVAQPQMHRDLFTELFAWRLTNLGAAAFGFLVAFVLLSHEIHAIRNLLLPLVAIVPAYMILSSLYMWRAARKAAKLDAPAISVSQGGARRLRVSRAMQSIFALACGAAIALWYVHSVANQR